jgi:hypothetical protein
MVDPAQCLFDSWQKPPVGTVQVNLGKLHRNGVPALEGKSNSEFF